MAAEAKDKKANKNLIIAIVVLVLILTGIFIYKHFKGKSTGADLPPYVPPANPGGASTPTSNDSFPLKTGSKGTNVKYLQTAINKFVDKNNLNNSLKLTVDGSFGNKTYNSLVTAVGTNTWWDPIKLPIYPVSLAAFTAILKYSNNSYGSQAPPPPPQLTSVTTYSY